MGRIFYGWWVVLACSLVGFYISGVIFFGFTAFFEPLIKEFGWSYTQVSFAASLRGLEMGIFAPLFGFLVDRLGSRKLIFFGTVSVGFSLILLSLTHSLVTFYAAFLLMAFGAGGCTSVVTMAAVAQWFDKNAGKAFGLMASGFGAGGLMVPLIVWMMEAFQWRTTLLLLGLGLWILGIPLTFVVRNRPEQYGDVPDGRSEKEAPPRPGIQKKGALDFRRAVWEKSFVFLILAEAVRMLVVTSVITHVMPYLGSVGLSRSSAGVVAAAVPLTSIIGRLTFGWLGDTFEKRNVMIAAFGLMAAGMLAYCWAPAAGMIVLFLLLFPPSLGGTMVLRGALLREYFGRDVFGKMMGIVMGAASLGGIAGPTLAGWVFDATGSYKLIWLIYAGSIVLAILLVLRIELRRDYA